MSQHTTDLAGSLSCLLLSLTAESDNRSLIYDGNAMGADWVKIRVRPKADANEVRELAAFVNEQFPHGRWIVPPSSLSSAEETRSRWQQALKRLESLFIFPKGELDDYWSYTALTDPPGMNIEVAFGGKDRVVPRMADIDVCRVYVISHNPVFPIEWRDEAYRIILPGDLPDFLTKWREYLKEVQHGLWRQYLRELFLSTGSRTVINTKSSRIW